MRTLNTVGLCVAGIGLASTLGACSQQDAPATSSTAAAEVAPMDQGTPAHTELSDAIVGPSDAPEGLAPGNFYEVFGSNQDPSPATLDPEACARSSLIPIPQRPGQKRL